MRIEIEVPRVAKSPNKLLGRHWYAKDRERNAWARDIIALLGHSERAALLSHWIIRANYCLHVSIVQYRKRELDPDNLVGSVKPILDAMTNLGLIRDDSSRSIQLDARQEKCPKGRSQFTVIRFMETKP